MLGKQTLASGSPRPLPTKWVVGLIVLLIGYTLLQPQLNQRLGWQLPSLSSLQQGEPAAPNSSNAASDESLRYGLLRETASDDFISPGGLRYTRGSAEGHRLKHLERHLQDDPDRPGKHGVFDGDMPQVLRRLDEAYTLAKRGGNRTKKSEEDGRTVYEVSFPEPVGYIGGRDGRRDSHPDARHIRLVVDGNKVITAFPF